MMKHKIVKYILFAILFLSAYRGIAESISSLGIYFNVLDFISSILFLLSMAFISIISIYTDKTKITIKSFLYYWVSVILVYNVADILDITWIESIAELLSTPFLSIFYILWELTDGETATVISIVSAYNLLPILMIIYFSIMISIWNKKNMNIVSHNS